MGCEVDERSVFGVGEVGFVIDRLGKALYITQVQVPPRAPKHSNPNLLPIGETFGFVVFLKDVKYSLVVAVQSGLLCTAH